MADLPKRKLGRTGLEVTVLGFGALELRGPFDGRGRPLGPGQAEQVLNAVLDAGINFIDTAVDYGESEENIGRYIAHRRREYFLATKCGCVLNASSVPLADRTIFGIPLPRLHDYGRKNIVEGVEQSLRRMKTDHLDLVQFHFGPTKELIEQERAIQTLLDLKREGKVRFIGSSSTLPNLLDHIKMGVFDAFQIPYSALQPEYEAAISQAARAGAGIIVRGRVASEDQIFEKFWKLWDKAKLDDLADGMTRPQFMIRFTIGHPDMSTTIVGTLDLAHLKENVAAAQKGPLPASVYHEAKRRVAAAGAAPV